MKKQFFWLITLAVCVFACTSVKDNSKTDFGEYPVYEGEWTEMIYSSHETVFQLWAPSAQEVRVLLYDEGQGGAPRKMFTMQPVKNGLWSVKVGGNLKGKFYAFNVKIDDVWQGDTPGVMAKAVGVNGNRAAIVDMATTNPKGWEKDIRPMLHKFNDIIVYEMHHRDFSADSTSGVTHKGLFLALTEDSAHTWLGEKTGLAHLKELGITHVHLMPSFDFASIDETKLDKPHYNWGYDPQNYFVPEGSYSTDPYRPEVRIKEFKQMVLALHKAGIRVIMDVVFNHTAMMKGSNFERTVPGYFYRMNEKGEPSDGSGCGNETASERPMMRRYMVEALRYWVNEYHVDGFRFDLMGLHDIETMNMIRKAMDEIDPTIYLYGEGWTAGKSMLPDSLSALKKNILKMPGIAAFSDELRDSLRGPFGADEKGAFIIGRPNHEMGVKFGIVGGIAHPQIDVKGARKMAIWAHEPSQIISYVSCHDDLCLVDRLKRTLPGISLQEQKALVKLAETAVLTSQGVPFLFAGDELMRDKRGVANSYASSDSINAINWSLKTINRDVFDYVRGLIQMRKAHPSFRLGNAKLINEHIEFLPVNNATNVVAFRIKGSPLNDSWLNTIVILNARTEPIVIDIPEGKYWIAARDGKIDLVMGLGIISGNQAKVSPQSALIIHQ